jgi:hypothetical protein
MVEYLEIEQIFFYIRDLREKGLESFKMKELQLLFIDSQIFEYVV